MSHGWRWGIALYFLMLANSSFAEQGEYLCSAHQAAFDQVALLDTDCPIGRSLSEGAHPMDQQSRFWIQCGLFPQALTMEHIYYIDPNVSESIWAKAEGGHQRCLIGPYAEFEQVKLELTQLRTVPGFDTAFIREIRP